MPLPIMAAVAQQESAGDPNAVSTAGAQGLYQFMPGTAAQFHISDPFNPLQSAFAAALYLQQLFARFGSWPLALAAYNAGPGAVEAAGNRIPDIPETQNYVRSILGVVGGKP